MYFNRIVLSMLLAAALPASSIQWKTPAHYRQMLHRPVSGTLAIDDTGVAFQSPGFSRRWSYEEIRTFELTGDRDLTIQDYENRHWPAPGERTFRFVLKQPMPPGVSAGLTARVGRPVINGNPIPEAAAIVELPAHRRERIGGSNGTLRFRQEGIDYVATDARGSRSWRWSDIQTIASPNAWEFRVTGYREIAAFDLKKPLSRGLFDRLWNILYAEDLHVAPPKEGDR
jgi:hypothetical protein